MLKEQNGALFLPLQNSREIASGDENNQPWTKKNRSDAFPRPCNETMRDYTLAAYVRVWFVFNNAFIASLCLKKN
jgi:hypothetical protein